VGVDAGKAAARACALTMVRGCVCVCARVRVRTYVSESLAHSCSLLRLRRSSRCSAHSWGRSTTSSASSRPRVRHCIATFPSHVSETRHCNALIFPVWRAGFVNCTADFTGQPEVMNGFSETMIEVFGRGLRSSTFRLNLSAFCGIRVHVGFGLGLFRRCQGMQRSVRGGLGAFCVRNGSG